MHDATCDDFRAELARCRMPIYILAASIRIHPRRLGSILSGRSPLTPELAARIRHALEKVDERSA
jgi:plasmid maintenance system antidote protein VapI